jgi:plastocyanin
VIPHGTAPNYETDSEGDIEMKTLKLILVTAAALVGMGFLTHAAWAGDVKGKVAVQGIRTPEGIAVYIDSVPGKTFSPPTSHVFVDQSHLAFAPHAIVILQGTTVEFKNDDNVGHNVYWPAINHDHKLAHNMGTWPQGQSKPFTFTTVGDVPLLCNVHPEMSGHIFVVPTPYFALTDKDGSFTIKDVPPGQYTLKTVSESGKPAEQAVNIGPSVISVNLMVSR